MSDYPRQLNLDDETKERLRSYLDEELLNHDAERSVFIDELIAWQEDYWAKPSEEEVTFPYKGAANLIIPLTAIAVEAVHARTMTTLFALEQFVSVKAMSDEFSEVAQPFEQFLDHELIHSMNIRERINDPLLELEKFGTGVGKSGYEKIIRTAVRTNALGEDEEFKVVTKQGATIDGVSLSRFLLPFYARTAQDAPWCGEQHSQTPYYVRGLAEAGMFYKDTLEKLEPWLNATANQDSPFSERKFERNQEELENRKPVWPKRLDWVEIWLAFDVDNSGVEKEIVVHYHRESHTFMSIRYNWHNDLHRPYRKGNYIPVEYRWTGVGICKQNEHFQAEVTAQHRQRLDNATLANVRMIKIHKLAGFGPKEPLFPGKMWFVDNMEDIETLQLGEIYPSAYNNEQATLQYSYQRTGVNEVTLGMPQVGTPGTATSDLARIQEGNKKFDYTYGNAKRLVAELVLDAACNIQQFGPKNLSYYTFNRDAEKIRQTLTLPPDLLRDCIILDINAAGQRDNKLVDRQNWQLVSQMITQYYTGMIQLAATVDPNLVALISQNGLTAGTEAMKQILQSFDIRNVDRITIEALLRQYNESIARAGAAQGTVSGPSQLVQPA
jgi:hypothetical protein